MTTTVSGPASNKSFVVAFYEAVRGALADDSRQTVHGSWLFGLRHPHLMDELREKFHDRIFEPPCAEAAAAALGIGAAMAGAPTFIDLSAANFSLLAFAQLINEASVVHYLSNGQLTAPVTFRIQHGMRGGGVQHSISPQSMLWNIPGLEIVIPSTPYDMKGLTRRAMKSPNPTIIIDHMKLFGIEGEVPDQDYEIPFGVADIKRAGRDVTLVATSYMVHVALDAAARLCAEGIEVEVLDPRTLVPFDEVTLLQSIRRTGRLIVLDEGVLQCGVASEIIAIAVEKGFSALKAPPVRLARAAVPTPYAPSLEAMLMPSMEAICASVRQLVGKKEAV
jgi:pyruvate/2-oxoglutarate/acetoin dehydrogenase E1 component